MSNFKAKMHQVLTRSVSRSSWLNLLVGFPASPTCWTSSLQETSVVSPTSACLNFWSRLHLRPLSAVSRRRRLLTKASRRLHVAQHSKHRHRVNRGWPAQVCHIIWASHWRRRVRWSTWQRAYCVTGQARSSSHFSPPSTQEDQSLAPWWSDRSQASAQAPRTTLALYRLGGWLSQLQTGLSWCEYTKQRFTQRPLQKSNRSYWWWLEATLESRWWITSFMRHRQI